MMGILINLFAAFYTHPYCEHCGRVCWVWQDVLRPSDAYHQRCFDIKYKGKHKWNHVWNIHDSYWNY